MKTLGIIGGIGPESTIEYYRFIFAAYRERVPDGSAPPLIINSIDLNKMLGLIGANQLKEVIEYLVTEVKKLAAAGADIGLLAANTPHIVFDEIQKGSPIPLISIVEATCKQAKSLGIKHAGLFGTRFTMQSDFYPKVFNRHGIQIAVPTPDDQNYIHEKYMNELVMGSFKNETREQMLRIVEKLVKTSGIEALILGGTELPLILRDAPAGQIPFLDTTKIHVESAVNYILSREVFLR